MEMKLHLHPEVYDLVSSGSKNVEIRLNDEKRRQLKIGDTLVFLKRPDNIESISARITNLVYFDSFLDVLTHYEMKRIHLESTTPEEFLSLLREFYTEEEEAKDGVVAIEFELIK